MARDDNDNRYNVEIQQETEGASYKRARYHSGLLDMNTLNSGQDYEELPDSYVIFITRDDVLGAGLPIYHADRIIKETGNLFGDGSHIIYVSSKIQDNNTELGKLMHDLHCRNAKEMYSEVLAERVSELKETEEGINSMCKEMEWIYREGEVHGETRGKAKGKAEERKKTAKALAQRGMPVEEIAEILGEKKEILKEWLTEEI